MARSSTFSLVDRIVGGDLAERLLNARADGRSFQEIALWLHDAYAIDVTDQTIRRWIRDLEADVEPAKQAS